MRFSSQPYVKFTPFLHAAKQVCLHILIGCIVLVSLGSCEEIVNPNLVSLEVPIVSIDGWLTDRPFESRVVLSRTAPFNSNDPNPRISGALVRIDTQRGRFFFQEDLNEPGLYMPIGSDFVVLPGNSYQLIVNIENTQYEAELAVAPSQQIDSLTYEFFDENAERDSGYYLTFYFKDPSGTNFYFWEVYKDGELISGQDINITDDVNVNNSNIEIELDNYTFALGDEAEVRLHTITKETFEYYQALKLLVDAGSPAQSVPENPISNIRDVSSEEATEVVGYFNATLSSSVQVEIQ
ncbi:MAG: DUF4249 family protein [Flammeovirgaceae bacterium]